MVLPVLGTSMSALSGTVSEVLSPLCSPEIRHKRKTIHKIIQFAEYHLVVIT